MKHGYKEGQISKINGKDEYDNGKELMDDNFFMIVVYQIMKQEIFVFFERSTSVQISPPVTELSFPWSPEDSTMFVAG